MVSKPKITIVGANHKTLPVELREVLARIGDSTKEKLKLVHDRLGISEAAVISTCNRFEVVVVGDGHEERVAEFFRSFFKNMPEQALYRYSDREAVRHLFRVGSGLDSLAVGEPQILGQVKEAYRVAIESGLAGKTLHALFQFAFRTAKRVRGETAIAGGGISLSYIAVELAERIFGDFSSRTVLILGSGKMAEICALHLRSRGCARIVVANRRVDRAAELANRVQGVAVSLSDLGNQLAHADMVIGSVAVNDPVVGCEMVRALRPNGALFFIDLGMPRNFDSAIGELDDVFLYTIDDLATIAEENRLLRVEAAKDAEVLIDYGVSQFGRWLDKVVREPDILRVRAELHRVCEDVAREILAERGGSGLNPLEVEGIIHRVTQKIAHKLQSDAIGDLKSITSRELKPIVEKMWQQLIQ